MSICNLEQNLELKNALANVIYNEILDAVDAKKPYKLSDTIKELYKNNYNEFKDETKALGLVAALPSLLFQVIEAEPSLFTKLASTGFNLDETVKFKNEIESSEDPLAIVKSIVSTEPVSVKVLIDTQLNPETKPTDLQSFPEADVIEVTGKFLNSNSYFATTGQQLDEANKLPFITKTNVNKNFYYNILQKLAVSQGDKLTFENVEYSGHTGFKLKALYEGNLPNAETNLYPGTKLDSKSRIAAVTDNNGNFLYFNEAGEITTEDKGKIAYFYLKNASEDSNAKLEAQLFTQLDNILKDTYKDDSIKYELEKAKAKDYLKKQITQEHNMMMSINTKLMNGQTVMLDITNANTGYVENTDILYKNIKNPEQLKAAKQDLDQPLSKYKLSKKEINSITVALAPIMIGGVLKTMKTSAIKFDNIKDFIGLKSGLLATVEPDIFNNIIKMFTEPLVNTNGKTFTANDIYDYAKQFINLSQGANKKTPFTVSVVNKKLVTTLNNKTLDLRNEADVAALKDYFAKNAFFTYIKTNINNTYTAVSITDGVVTKKDESYDDLVLKNMIPRVGFDSTTQRPLSPNGYFTFKLADEATEVQDKAKEVVNIVKPVDLNFDLDVYERSKLLQAMGTPEQNAKAEAWLKSSALFKAKDANGKPLFNIHDLRNVVNSEAWATFKKATITLYAGSDFTTGYHEAWHAFSQVYLTKADRDGLYDAVGKLPGTFKVIRKNNLGGITNLSFETVKFSEATRKEKEEFIAEEFRTFAVNNGNFKTQNAKTNIFQRIFDRIWKALQTLFKGTSTENVFSNPGSEGILSEIFNTLYLANTEADLSKYKPDINNGEFTILNSGPVKEDGSPIFQPTELALLTRSMDGIISKLTTSLLTANVPKYNAVATLLTTNKGLTNLYGTTILSAFTNRLETLKAEYEQEQKSWDEITRNYKAGNIDLLERAIKNFGDINEILNTKLSKDNLISYHIETSAFADKIRKEADEDTVEKLGDKSGNETDSLELAAPDAVFLLKSLIKQTETANKEIVDKANSLGFPELIDYSSFFRVLIDKAGGEKRVDELYNKLVELKNVSPLFNQLLVKLGDPSKVIPASKYAGQMWLGITRTLNLEKENLVSAQYIIEEDAAKKSDFKVLVGKVSGDNYLIKNKKWPTRFATEVSPFVEQNSDNQTVLKLDTIANKFLKQEVDSEGVIRYMVPAVQQIAFLNAIGMFVEDNSYIRKAIAEISDSVNYIADSIGQANFNKSALAQRGEAPITNIVTFLSKKHPNVQLQTKTGVFKKGNIESQASLVNKIAQIDADYSVEFGNSMISIPGGGKKSTSSLNSSLTQIVYAMNKAAVTGDFKADGNYSYAPHLAYANNPTVMGSIFMKNLYDLKGDRITDKHVEIVDLVGSQITDAEGISDGVAHGKMSMNDKFITDFSSLLSAGYIEAVRHGEKSTYSGVRLNKVDTYRNKLTPYLYIDTQAFLKNKKGDYLLGFDPFDVLIENIMMPKLEGELRRIKMIKSNPELYKKVKNFWNRGIKLDFFDKILQTSGESLVGEYADQLTDTNNLNDLLNTNPGLREKISNDIKSYYTEFKERIEKNNYNKTFEKDRVSKVPTFLNKVATEHLSKEQIDAIANDKNIKDALLYSFVINSSIHANEVILLELGDGFQFYHNKDESTKRVPTYNSTGIIFPTDTLAQMFINTHVGRPYEDQLIAEGKLVRKNTNQKSSRTYNGTGIKAIIKESVVDSNSDTYKQYADMFRHWLTKRNYKGDINEALYGKEGTFEKPTGGLMKPYTGIKDGDGQGWVSFDTYRQLKELENNWSLEQEAAYQKELKGLPISPAELEELFPVYKLQYAGPLKTKDGEYPVQSIDKFSLFPLIPSVIKGMPLEQMHLAMMAQNVDYALFDSGAKRSYIRKDDTTNGDVIYDGTTDKIKPYTEIEFTPNDIHFEYLKNQTEISKVFKGKSTLSTQLRKVFNISLFNEGTPIDYTGSKDWSSLSNAEKIKASPIYKNTEVVYDQITRLTSFMKDQLIKDLGWELVNGKPKGDILNMINFVKKELVKQDYSQHEIDFIEYETNSDIDLSLSPEAARLEKLLMAVVNNRLVRLKIKGEALVQFSAAFTNPTPADIAKYDDFGTNGLRPYVVDPKGKENTKGVRVKVALTENYQNLFNTTYYETKDGKTVDSGKNIAVYIKNPDTESKKKFILDYQASFNRLNEMIKNDTWLSDENNRKALMITGVRIPTQGPNSIEFAEIWEFLPASAGPIIIIPAEIVAKSGGDFDVDKLTMYIKHITKTGKTLNDSYNKPEDLDSLIKEAEDKLKALKGEKLNVVNYLNDFRETFNTEKNHKNVSKTDERKYANKNNEQLLKVLKDPNSQEFLKKNFKASYKVYENTLKKFTTEDLVESENMIDELFSKKGELNSLFKTVTDLKEQKRYFTAGIQNKLVDDIVNVMQMPEMAFALMQPNDTHLTQPLAKELEETFKTLNNIQDKKGPLGTSPTSLSEYDYNLQKQQDNISGKEILGMIALQNTFSNLLTIAGATMNPSLKLTVELAEIDEEGNAGAKQFVKKEVPIHLRLNSNTKVVKDETLNAVSVISLSNRTDAEKINAISDVLSQLMNGAVDVGKDAWIAYLQGNMEVINKILFLLQTGVPITDIAYFVSNPLTKAYVQEKINRSSPLAKIKYGPKTNTSISFAKKEARRTFLNSIIKDPILKYNKNNIWVFDHILNTKYKNVSFSKATLKAVANSKMNVTDPNQIAGFLQYLYIEDLIEEFDNFKSYLNVDTSTSIDNYEAQAKLNDISKIENFQTLNKDILKWFKEKSPISSFFVQEFARSLFGENLFKTRDNKIINDFLLDLTDNLIAMSILKRDTIVNKNSLVSKFKNALSLYIFTNNLKNYKKGNTEYKGVTLSKLFNSKIKNIEELNKDFRDKTYYANSKSENSYLKRGLFPVKAEAFGENDQDAFIEFSIEREYLRTLYSYADISKSSNFKLTRDALIKSHALFTKQENETEAEYINRINNLTYENILMHKALNNTFNDYELFKAKDYSVAKRLMDIIKNNPELEMQFGLISQFAASHITNKRKNLARSNFKIKNLFDLDRSLTEEYYNDWVKLADPTINKVSKTNPNYKQDNLEISEFFKSLPIVAFLQTGMDSSEFSLNKIMPYDNYRPIMEKASDSFYKLLESDEKQAKKILEGFFILFKENNSTQNRLFRGRGLSYKKSLKQLLEMVDNTSPYALSNQESVSKIEEGIYLINTRYVNNYGEVVTLSDNYLKQTKDDNPQVKVLLTDADLDLDFTDLTTTEALNNAKSKLDTKIAEIIGSGVSIYLNSNGYGQNLVISTDFNKADKLTAIEQNFADGVGGRKMQDKFKGKSTMELIISGDRTRTTRANTDIQRMIKDYGLSKISDLVGQVIRMTDKTGVQVYTKITKVTPFTQEYQDQTWEKEGWEKAVTDKNVGQYPYAIEFEVVENPNQITSSLQDELLLYLNTKLKDSFGYDNPGSTPDASPLDIINRTQFSTDQDVNNKKEEC